MILKVTGRERGAIGTAVIDYVSQRVYKIFKSNRHPAYRGEDTFEDERNRLIFSSEIEAYKIIQANPILQTNTPMFFGVYKIDKVLDHRNNDVSDWYLLDCCYCMNLCVGEEIKPWQGRQPHLECFAKLMVKHGITFVIDSSVFNPDSAMDFKFIDFATHDASEKYYEELELA